MKLIVYIYNELCSFKVIKLDVCGSLVLSNPVTYELLHPESDNSSIKLKEVQFTIFVLHNNCNSCS